MPATALPSSGDSPNEGPGARAAAEKTCDARGMAEIHRMFRAGFGEGPALVGGVLAGGGHVCGVGLLRSGPGRRDRAQGRTLVPRTVSSGPPPCWLAQ